MPRGAHKNNRERVSIQNIGSRNNDNDRSTRIIENHVEQSPDQDTIPSPHSMAVVPRGRGRSTVDPLPPTPAIASQSSSAGPIRGRGGSTSTQSRVTSYARPAQTLNGNGNTRRGRPTNQSAVPWIFIRSCSETDLENADELNRSIATVKSDVNHICQVCKVHVPVLFGISAYLHQCRMRLLRCTAESCRRFGECPFRLRVIICPLRRLCALLKQSDHIHTDGEAPLRQPFSDEIKTFIKTNLASAPALLYDQIQTTPALLATVLTPPSLAEVQAFVRRERRSLRRLNGSDSFSGQ